MNVVAETAVGANSEVGKLRAVLVQRHIDRIRAERRTTSLPDEDFSPSSARASECEPPDPNRSRYLALIQQALERATVRLAPRDRTLCVRFKVPLEILAALDSGAPR